MRRIERCTVSPSRLLRLLLKSLLLLSCSQSKRARRRDSRERCNRCNREMQLRASRETCTCALAVSASAPGGERQSHLSTSDTDPTQYMGAALYAVWLYGDLLIRCSPHTTPYASSYYRTCGLRHASGRRSEGEGKKQGKKHSAERLLLVRGACAVPEETE